MGGRCDACVLGAAYHGQQISIITPPPGTMGELPDAPPVLENGTFHVYEMAEAQRKDPIISWFVRSVVKPVEQGKRAKVVETPDMHPDAKQMLRLRSKFRMGAGPAYGTDEVLIFKKD